MPAQETETRNYHLFTWTMLSLILLLVLGTLLLVLGLNGTPLPQPAYQLIS